jgi:hypothetical protein
MAGTQSAADVIVMIILAILMLVIIFAIFGVIVQITWNMTMPMIFPGVGQITLYQAIALFILASILFGGFRMGGDACNACYSNMAQTQPQTQTQTQMHQ